VQAWAEGSLILLKFSVFGYLDQYCQQFKVIILIGFSWWPAIANAIDPAFSKSASLCSGRGGCSTSSSDKVCGIC
jgi:hypothetical protein